MAINDGFTIPATAKRVGGLWRIHIEGQEWFIRELLSELETTGGFKLAAYGDRKIELEQPHPLFHLSEKE